MTRAFPTQTDKKANRLAAKLWEYCNVLRDSGLSTAEFVEQLTYLIFLKMADEIAIDRFIETKERPDIAPAGYDWKSLTEKTGPDLGDHYRMVLAELAMEDPATTVGTLFAGSQNRISNDDLLRKLIVNLIDTVDWTGRDIGLKGDAFEVLLARSAEDTKTGAGQFFTPRPLVNAIVDVMQPRPTDTIADPACGTGGFLIASHRYILEHHFQELSPKEFRALRSGRIWGQELVQNTVRLAVMNMLLHGLGSIAGKSLVVAEDALLNQPSRHASLVLAHPPFGKTAAITTVDRNGMTEKEDVRYPRNDFRITTTNKQINFLQHIMSLMDMNGRAAVIVPDNVLFESGACLTLRRRLLDDFDLHTILRLPTGIFYASGVKANVLFFNKKPSIGGKPNTSKLWVYDFRTGMQFSLKQKPLQQADLTEFVEAYLPGRPRTDRVETEHFRCFSYDELIARDHANLDIVWENDSALDDIHSATPPGLIAREIIENLETALEQFVSVAEELDSEPPPRTDMQQ
ncbi:type I restriction-modification system subunit M [Streptomyces sp. NBC_00243]|uniref:class I SAM-dependent DNA methyltransferase n=1 Tax=Streptomyces sp. NBC_00243 TaxID=2975688 RepID=UPI002DDC728D|nr:class I SAM-dependent DNA methyltransferase [Streptomyces sp. NBC_00243]WRZ22978.1 type I restriction-modification system subunit M [Streptomyces sp. NBC_00243]